MGGKVERFCDIGNMICQWEEMEGEVLEGGMEDGGRAEKPVGGLVNVWGSLEREEEGTLVKLDAGNNKLCGKNIIAKRYFIYKFMC